MGKTKFMLLPLVKVQLKYVEGQSQWKATIVRSLKHWIDNSNQELIVYVSYSHMHEISLTGIINH